MRNPYEVLELKEGASQEEIKQAYRNLARKYHPDQYGNNPLKDLAEDKIRELNEAYEQLTKNSNEHSNHSYNSSSDLDFNSIRMNINRGNFSYAEQQLNNVSNRNAEWNYLMGVINMNKGWYDAAFNYINTACKLDPFNREYSNTLNSLNNRNRSYRQPYYGSSRNNGEFCDICLKLWCLDSMCECCGGDIISCC